MELANQDHQNTETTLELMIALAQPGESTFGAKEKGALIELLSSAANRIHELKSAKPEN